MEEGDGGGTGDGGGIAVLEFLEHRTPSSIDSFLVMGSLQRDCRNGRSAYPDISVITFSPVTRLEKRRTGMQVSYNKSVSKNSSAEAHYAVSARRGHQTSKQKCFL